MRFIVYGTYFFSPFFLCVLLVRRLHVLLVRREEKNRNRFNRTNSQTNIYLIPFIMHIIRIYFIWSFFLYYYFYKYAVACTLGIWLVFGCSGCCCCCNGRDTFRLKDHVLLRLNILFICDCGRMCSHADFFISFFCRKKRTNQQLGDDAWRDSLNFYLHI